MPDPSTSRSEVRYERSDANAVTVVGFASGLVFLIVFVFLGVAWLFDACKVAVDGEDNPLPRFAAEERIRLPQDLRRIQSPRLQEDESAALQRLRQTENARLNEYGWIDAKAGIIHIPIAEAMRLLADPKTAETHGLRVDVPKKKGGR